MTSPRPVSRAELEHPSWCQTELCPLDALGAGGFHQREFPVFEDDGTRFGSVLLRGYARGRVTISVKSRRPEFSPRQWEIVILVAAEALRVLDAAERVA